MITSETPGEAPRHVNIDYDAAEGIFPVKVWNDLNYIQGFAFHPAYGELAVSRDENGVETRAQHDAFGRLRRVERDGEAGLDVVSSVILKNGWVAGLVEHVKSDAGDEGYTAFDELGRPVEEAVRAFDGQWLNYDKRGRRVALADPDRGVTFTTYNGFDEVLAEENALGEVTEFKHDILGRIYEREDADGVTKFAWSAQQGRLGLLDSTPRPGSARRRIITMFSGT